MGRHANRWIPLFVLAWAVVVAPACRSAASARHAAPTPSPASARAAAGPVPVARAQGTPAFPGTMMRRMGATVGCAGRGGRMARRVSEAAVEASAAVVADCPPPTSALAAQGRKIFTGKGNCSTCHGMDAKGTPLAPNLVQHQWLNIDGSYAAISGLVQRGVPQPKQHPAPMPPTGGASLSPGEICAVAAYVYLLSHKE